MSIFFDHSSSFPESVPAVSSRRVESRFSVKMKDLECGFDFLPSDIGAIVYIVPDSDRAPIRLEIVSVDTERRMLLCKNSSGKTYENIDFSSVYVPKSVASHFHKEMTG